MAWPPDGTDIIDGLPWPPQVNVPPQVKDIDKALSDLLPLLTSSKTGSLTSASSTVDMFRLDKYPSALVTLSGTYTGLTIKFQVSNDNGSNWYGIQFYNNTDGQAYSANVNFSPTNSTNYSFLINLHGAQAVRIVATAYSSGTAQIRITPDSGAFPFSISNTGNTLQVDLSSSAATSISNATQPVLRANTTGKTLWVSQLSFQFTSAPAAGEFDISDGSGGPKKLILQTAASDTDRKVYNFAPNPLKFSTGVAVNSTIGNNSIFWTIVGWEQ